MQKAFILITFFTFSAFSIYAQEENEPKYLFSGDLDISITGFGGPFVSFFNLDGEFAVGAGGGGAVLLNQRYFLAGYGIGLATKHYRNDLYEITGIENPNNMFMGMVDSCLGYIHNYHKAIHWCFSTKLGWGEISIVDEYYYNSVNDRKGRDVVFVINPQLELELNFTKWFKMNVGAGYNFTTGIDKTYIDVDGNTHDYYNSSDFSYPQATISLLFGGFGKKV